MILFEEVTKKYPLGNVALSSVSFSIESNEFLFLVGPSGAGKTTILKLLIRQILPTNGNIIVEDENIVSKNYRKIAQLRRKIGIVFQDFKILDDKNIAENIALSLKATHFRESDTHDEIQRVLNLVGLKNKSLLFPAQLSAGELQRVAIARAVSGNRKIILADEPTGNLDPKTSWDIMKIFKQLEKKKTIIIATHNAEIVNSLKRRVITLKDGKIISDKRKGGYDI